MSASRLVQWCALFGVSEGTARVALSRMVERGELRGSDGVYELVGRVRGRASAQDWSLDPKPQRWRGEWRSALVVAPARASADRAALRDAMRQLHYAELREGVWTRPDNLPRAAGSADAWDVLDAQCAWWTGRPEADARDLAVELFAPEAWARTADRLRVRLEREHSLADAFHAGAAALAHVRADPLLPPELGPSAEAGDALRSSYRQWERGFAIALRAWFRDQA
jgi:phenylacetic acid degradation operon negative regulatory protein